MRRLQLLLLVLLAWPIGMLAQNVKSQEIVKPASWKSTAVQGKIALTRAGSAKVERIADMGTFIPKGASYSARCVR